MDVLIIVLFSAFALLDAVAVVAKYVGGAVSLGGVGYTISNIVHTIKRLFVVSYPPVIAMKLLDDPLESLFTVIYVCYFTAAFIALGVFLKRDTFKRVLARQIHSFGSGGSLWKAWEWKTSTDTVTTEASGGSGSYVDLKLFLSALWVYFFFGSVYFLINVAGYTFKDYSTVVLQLTGVINAIGTFILAFYLDPILAKIFERERDRADLALRSVLWAQVLNFGIVSPLAFYSLSLFLF